ncbi:MAG: lysozyme [bacterium]
MILLFFMYFINSGNKNIEIKEMNTIEDFSNKTNTSIDNIIDRFDDINKELSYVRNNHEILVNPLKLRTSEKGKEFIKSHEGLRLKAYKLGDGMITIGYGHAKPIKKSKYKEGDIITKEEAEKIFEKDIKVREEGIKKIFKEWIKEGIYVKISQNMFDSMVSMAFNMGLNGLKQSYILTELKEGNFESAADSILVTRISDRFPGLYKRRKEEKKLFLENFTNNLS